MSVTLRVKRNDVSAATFTFPSKLINWSTLAHTWTLLGFGFGKNKGYFKKMSSAGNGSVNNIENDVDSWSDPEVLYVGWFDDKWDSSPDFIINSITMYNDHLPGMNQDYYMAPYFGKNFYNFIELGRDWGNGVRNGAETCDDGNWNTGDGCDDNCAWESGYTCKGGSASGPDTCSNGWVASTITETIDQALDCFDNNAVDGDGWDASWKVEAGYVWPYDGFAQISTCTDDWGDGILITSMGPSYCDDGDNEDGDGWDSTCTVEDHWECPGGTATSPSEWTEICGDGVVIVPTTGYCDDNGRSPGDGCSVAWAVENGWDCTLGDSSTASSCTEICGDGMRFNTLTTYCDDNNTTPGDGWDNNCNVETGWQWSGGDESTPDTCFDAWGDGKVVDPKVGYWDDNDKDPGDGCDSNCAVETGWDCTLGDFSTASVCTEEWGDGMRFNTLTTYCDDNNTTPGDGWDNNWAVETSWEWSGGDESTPDTCNDIWGDGIVIDPQPGFWDDGDQDDGDGWDSSWAVETGYTCAQDPITTTSSWSSETWGDGVVISPTAGHWDDGDQDPGDGCSASCVPEAGWVCTLGDSSTASVCTDDWGDGDIVKTSATYCDDGDNADNDGWSATCQIESGWTCTNDIGVTSTWKDLWGDGLIYSRPLNYWDDGNSDETDGCTNSWVVSPKWEWSGGDTSTADTCSDIWGDGFVVTPQTGYWDDGGTATGDGCDNNCNVESGWNWTLGGDTTASEWTEIWGDGKVMKPIAGYWDDGNTEDGDGCSSTWAPEADWTCTLGDSLTASVCSDLWGDGKVVKEATGYWDDGNGDETDGWTSSCVVQATYNWYNPDPLKPSEWYQETWGDGSIGDPYLTAYWDDGGNDDGDGCSSSWSIEIGFTCVGGGPGTPSVCSSWSIPNCSEWNTFDSSQCETWEDGYEKNDSGECIKSDSTSTDTDSSLTAYQELLAAIVGISCLKSLINLSSPNMMWTMVNQIQLLLLLILTKTSMPDRVHEFITSNGFTMLSFNFLNLEKLSFLKVPEEWLYSPQSDKNLEAIGIEAYSTYNNIFSILFITLCLLPLHMIVILLPKWKDLSYSQSEWKSKFGKFYNFAQSGLFEFLTFTVYLRMFLESYQHMLLASISEISNLDYGLSATFGIAIGTLAFLLTLLSLSFYLFFISGSTLTTHNFYSLEMIRGIRNTRKAKFYTVALLLRRIVFVTALISLKSYSKYTILTSLAIFQVIYFVRIITMLPYENQVENLVEITNEIFFIILSGSLFYWNTEDVWKGSAADGYIIILVANNAAVLSIILGKFINNPHSWLHKRGSQEILQEV